MKTEVTNLRKSLLIPSLVLFAALTWISGVASAEDKKIPAEAVETLLSAASTLEKFGGIETATVVKDLSVKRAHGLAISIHHDLSQALDSVTDPKIAQEILTQMQEVLNWINYFQNKCFTEQMDSLKSAIIAIELATLETKYSLKVRIIQ